MYEEQPVVDRGTLPEGDAARPYLDMVDKIRRIRQPMERRWKLNQAFYEGNQYTFVNRKTSRIESLGTEPGDKPRWRVRLMSNQITRNAQTLVAKLNKTRPAFYASPNDTDIDSVHASTTAEALMNSWWDNMRIDKTIWLALLNARISGGFIKVLWDDEAGEPMEYMVDPEGNPIMEYTLREIFTSELEAEGIDPAQFNVTSYTGDIRLDVLNGHQVLIDPAASRFEDADYVICVHGMAVDRIKAKWGIDVVPDSSPLAMETNPVTWPGTSTIANKENTVKEVFYGYWKPTAALPKGRYIVFMRNPNTVLYQSEWPYPFRRLPLVKLPGIPLPGSPYDGTEIEQAIPLQRELNRSLSQVVEFKNMGIAPQLLAPVGSMRERRTNEPGAVFTFNPVAGLKPEPIPVQAIPPYVLQHIADIGARIKEIFGLNEVTTGQVPPNVEAALAIDLLQEMAMDSLAPMVDEIEASIADLGNMMVAMAGQYYDEARLISMVGANARIRVDSFMRVKNNLATGAVIRVEAGSKMPRTRAGRQARILQLKQEGVISPAQAQKWLDLADFTGLRAVLEADENQALREHERVLRGEPINPVALWQAEQAVMAGQADPSSLMQAAFSPNEWDNHEAHLQQHAQYMKSVEFERQPPDKQQPMRMHYAMHLEAVMQMAPKPEPPKVTLQTRMAIGPTVAHELLGQAGVDVPPEALLEPPIETVVFDNEDKANEPNALDELRKTAETAASIDLKRAQAAKAMADSRKADRDRTGSTKN